MAVGPATLPPLYPVAGIRLGASSAGIKQTGRQDLVLIELAAETQVAGTFTRNAFCAAPVTVAKRHLLEAPSRYFVINTGNANAGTGAAGIAAAVQTCRTVAELTEVKPEQVLPFSTGVIGEPLPVDRLCNALPATVQALDEAGWQAAAEAILTTDTRPKGASLRLAHEGGEITLTGIAKGSGMIRPDMATMLAFIATDAEIEAELLNTMLQEAVRLSFNRITVDGDTSTNDAVMLAATGLSGIAVSTQDPALYGRFSAALNLLCQQLAEAIVRDGEGATKLVRVQVEAAADEEEALRVAYTIAESPLVKTALFAADPNWGRILAAVGRSGLTALVIENVNIHLGEVSIVRNGELDPVYTEAAGAAVMAEEEVSITVSLGRGAAEVTVLTADLSYDYVKINAEYRS